MVATAKLMYLGVSPQKVRLVVDQVRGKPVEEAIGILHYSPKRVSKDLEKLLKSAVANAQQKDPELDVDRLVISQALVNDAPTLRRARSRAMGRIFPILKRACHVQFDLDVSRSAAQGG